MGEWELSVLHTATMNQYSFNFHLNLCRGLNNIGQAAICKHEFPLDTLHIKMIFDLLTTANKEKQHRWVGGKEGLHLLSALTFQM